MADVLVSDSLIIPDGELRVSFARSGGPGGQHVNKSESKVVLRWSPSESGALSDEDREWLITALASRLTQSGDLIVTAEETRDQSRNRERAEQKLGDLVRDALRRPTPRKVKRAPRRVKEERLKDKKLRGNIKRHRRPPSDS